MTTIKSVPAVVNPEIEVEFLVRRIYAALDEIAEACDAWHCMNCGEWTLEMVTIENHSDEMGYETTEGCPRCAEVR
jgi:hypothetical protein